MKPHEIVKDSFIVGGPDITDGRDGCVYLLNLGELILSDTGAGWSVEKIIYTQIERFFTPHKGGEEAEKPFRAITSDWLNQP
jgi:hypothetical protein